MNQQTNAQSNSTIPATALHAWLMTAVCLVLLLLAAAAATRLPHYLATGDVVRLMGTILFDLLALAGLVDNVHTHVLVWQKQNRATNQPEMAAQRTWG